MAAAMAAGSALLQCQSPNQPAGLSQPLTADLGREATALVPAARCGECHGRTESQWRGSAHAQADTSALYRAMRTDARTTSCDRCHAPLRAVAPTDPVAAEGVSCDVCHTISSVQVGRIGGAGFALRLDDAVRYGPLCDAKPHYFHSMGCSPLHEAAEFCAACHNWSRQLPNGTTLALYPEYQEWLEESAVGSGISCQSCHMPGERAEVAVGWPERSGVPRHSFLGRGDLRRRALTGRARVTLAPGKLTVHLALTNSGAGHAVPTGLPERQLRVSVELLDASGRVTASQEHLYGRVLVDAVGKVVPFYDATSELADTRIKPGETREDLFVLPLAAPLAAGQLRVSVLWRPISPTLAARLGVPAPPDEPVLAAALALPVKGREPNAAVELRL